jgi:zinc protease
MRQFLSLFFLILSLGAAAQSDLSQVIPLDPTVRSGTLPNGIRYYIRKNSRPEKRAEFRLAVNAGSTAEDDNQQGLAHVVEHMAFNGTKNFKKSEIVDYLESVGTKFGAHLNAYTSFDETVYMLQLPTDKEDIVNKGLMILEDWAHNLSFDSAEVEKERGVVVEEWRLGQGADERMRRTYWPVLFRDSRYQDRLPIGKKEIIEGCRQSVLRDFYYDWYRPDLMAVIAVGDFDPDTMEMKIKQRFSGIPVKDNARPLKVWPVPDNDALAISRVTDKEARMAEIQLIYKQPVAEVATVGDYRTSIARNLFSGMLSARLSELQRKSNPPFVYAGSYYTDLVRNKDAYMAFAYAKEDGIERALQSLVAENERVRRFGFTSTELDRIKADLMSEMEKSFNERDKTESRDFAREYVSNFLTKEPAPGISFEYDIYKAFLSSITLEEVNAFAAKWITDGSNCVVLITAPDKPTLKMPEESTVRSIMGGMKQLTLDPYVDEVLKQPLLDVSALRPGKVVSTSGYEVGNITKWQLSNGINVWLKPTDFKNEILLNAFSWGGTSMFSDSDYISAAYVDDVIRASGLGDFDATALEKALSGKVVDGSAGISELQHGFNGRCAPKDAETMFQLLYKTFTQPRRDTAAFRSMMTNVEASVRNRLADPGSVFMDTVSHAMSGYNLRYRSFTADRLVEVDLDKVMRAYQRFYSNASDFTVVLIGNFKTEDMKPLVERYLASLPSNDLHNQWKDIGARAPKGRFERTVSRGTEPKSTVMLRFNQPFQYNRNNRNELMALTKLMNIRLREVLREEKSGVYGVSFNAIPRHYPLENLELVVYFSCSPDNIAMLTDAALAVIKEVKEKGCEEKNVVKIRETLIRERETSLKENDFWMSYIVSSCQNGENVSDMLVYNDWVNALKAEDLKVFASKYLVTDNYARFVLVPEKK